MPRKAAPVMEPETTETAAAEPAATEKPAPKEKKITYTHGERLKGEQLTSYFAEFAKVKAPDDLIRDAGFWTKSFNKETGAENEVIRRADFWEALAIAEGKIEAPTGTRGATQRNRKPTATVGANGGFIVGARHTELAKFPVGCKVWIEAAEPAEGEEYGSITIKFHEAPAPADETSAQSGTEMAGDSDETGEGPDMEEDGEDVDMTEDDL